MSCNQAAHDRHRSEEKKTEVDAERIAANVLKLRTSMPPTVELVGVSKGVSATAIRAAYGAGVRHFGESRVQEAERKRAELSDLSDITWHLIGHLQTKKAKKALQLFDWIDSLDRLDLARRLDRLAAESARSPLPQVCLQVKLAPDPNKYGWTPVELLDVLPQLLELSHIRIRGLMTILPQGCDAAGSLHLFEQLRQWRDRLQADAAISVDLPVLSMGMSGDYPQAIAAGATIVRVGRGLFQ